MDKILHNHMNCFFVRTVYELLWTAIIYVHFGWYWIKQYWIKQNSKH